VEISDELSQDGWFPVQEKPLVVPGNRRHKVLLSVLHARPGRPPGTPVDRGARSLSASRSGNCVRSQEVDGFEQVGFPLPVLTEEEVCARAKFDLLKIEIPELIEAETDYLHT